MASEEKRDARRKAEFDAMPVTNKCDAGCGRKATTWFGATSCATCGSAACVAVMQRERDAIMRSLNEPEEDYYY